jgi:hypothetical protein
MQTQISDMLDTRTSAFPLWCEFNEPDDLPDEDDDEFDDDEFVSARWK